MTHALEYTMSCPSATREWAFLCLGFIRGTPLIRAPGTGRVRYILARAAGHTCACLPNR